MTDQSSQAIARERLLAAGVTADQLPSLLERATQLIEGLRELARLDPELPEPALVWFPIDEAAS